MAVFRGLVRERKRELRRAGERRSRDLTRARSGVMPLPAGRTVIARLGRAISRLVLCRIGGW